MKINADTHIRDLVREHPETAAALAELGMRCPACKGSENETIRRASRNHGVPLPSLLEKLKAAAKPGP